jgi:endogenous inhibitor of DNA gyrase (YacG/DUF329 family)
MNDASAPPRFAPCPICSKPAQSAHRPFCSKRCRDVDLGRWLRGVYRVESDDPPEDGNADDQE